MTLVDQVRVAKDRLGWSVQRLLDESGLEMDRSSLARKLSGDQPATTDELEALAQAMGVTLAFVPVERHG